MMDFFETEIEEVEMPNKTIYVADHDVPLFDRAQELAGGNLSAAITTALQRFVEQEGETPDGEIVVKVGTGGAYLQKRFHGRLLGKQTLVSPDQATISTIKVYLTPKGNFAVYRKDAPNWSRRQWSHGANWTNGGNWWEPISSLEVNASIDELRGHIPDHLLAVVTQRSSGTDIEDLDI